VKTLPVTETEHTRVWLMKHRLRAKDLNEVVRRALDALAEREGWGDLTPPPEGAPGEFTNL